jgi:hypothetical protein
MTCAQRFAMNKPETVNSDLLSQSLKDAAHYVRFRLDKSENELAIKRPELLTAEREVNMWREILRLIEESQKSEAT